MRETRHPARGARVIILSRYSSDLQNPLSAEDQILRCREECERHGWTVVDVYKDEAKSGRSVGKRSGYIAAMAAAISGRCDLIMLTALDRLGRNARELNDARYRLSDHDVQIYIVGRGILTSFEFALRAEIAQDEAERIGERVSHGQRAAAARGKIMGDAAYGYRLLDTGVVNRKTKKMQRTIEIDPVTSKVVLRIHEDYDAGVSPVAIAAALMREGVPTPEGGADWHPNTILGVKRYRNGILRNPIVAGLSIHGKTTVTLEPRSEKFIKKEAAEDNFIVTEHLDLAIVPRDLYDRNQARIEARSFELPNRNRGNDYLLSGLMICSECGRGYMMVARKLGCIGRKIHACDNRRRVDRTAVERVVLDGLRERLAREDIVQHFLPEYLAETKRSTVEAIDRHSHATQRLEVVEREIAALVKQARAGAEGYAAKILNDELAELGAERDRLSRDLKASPPPAPPPTSAADVAERLRCLVDNLEIELAGPERDAQRATDLIRSIITEVKIEPIEPEGRPDGRGAGPVRVTVTGKITQLVSAALLDRKILHGHGAEDVQGLPIATFRYYGDIARETAPGEEGVLADAALVARLLDDYDYPVAEDVMRDEIARAAAPPSTAVQADFARRRRMAVAYLIRAGWIRRLKLPDGIGWAWAERGGSDEEWVSRYRRRAQSPPSELIIRVTPPSAAVVVIGERWPPKPPASREE